MELKLMYIIQQLGSNFNDNFKIKYYNFQLFIMKYLFKELQKREVV